MIAKSQVDDDPLFRKVVMGMQRDHFFLFGRRWWSTCAVSWRLEVGGVSYGRKDLRHT